MPRIYDRDYHDYITVQMQNLCGYISPVAKHQIDDFSMYLIVSTIYSIELINVWCRLQIWSYKNKNKTKENKKIKQTTNKQKQTMNKQKQTKTKQKQKKTKTKLTNLKSAFLHESTISANFSSDRALIGPKWDCRIQHLAGTFAYYWQTIVSQFYFAINKQNWKVAAW